MKTIGNVSGVQGDVAKLADLDRLYDTVSKVTGPINIVFRQRWRWRICSLGALTEEHFDKIFNINVRGTLFTVQKALPLLKDGGSMAETKSAAALRAIEESPAYWRVIFDNLLFNIVDATLLE